MRPLIIGIAGGTGSGKTTVAKTIARRVASTHVSLLCHDSYYKSLTQEQLVSLASVNFDHPDAFDTHLLREHLLELRAGASVIVPQYDFVTHKRQPGGVVVHATKIIIVEGILLFVDSELRSLFDIKIFVDTDTDERLMRRISRDIAERGRALSSVIEQYRATVKPMHLAFVEPSKHWADVIIPRGAENDVAIDMVVSRIGIKLFDTDHLQTFSEDPSLKPSSVCFDAKNDVEKFSYLLGKNLDKVLTH